MKHIARCLLSIGIISGLATDIYFRTKPITKTVYQTKVIYKYKSKTENKHKVKHINHFKQEIDDAGFFNYSVFIQNSKKRFVFSNENHKNDLYLINSLQKSITAAMIAKEIENDNLSFDTTLDRFYPNISNSDKITIKQLLNMESGLTLNNEKELLNKKYKNQAQYFKTIEENISFDESLQNMWHYDSVNYVILSGILEKIEHKSYEKIFNEQFARPLELKHTYFYWQFNKIIENQDTLLIGHNYSGQKESTVKTSNYARHILGAGSIVTNNTDLSKIFKFILNDYLNSKTKHVLYKSENIKHYAGGFYVDTNTYKANGMGEGYMNFVRINKKATKMFIIQSNMTKQHQFKQMSNNTDTIWNTEFLSQF